MKRIVCDALLFLALFVCFTGTRAQEFQIGNLIYIPAMNTVANAGSIELSVEGLMLPTDSDEPVVVSSIAGAEFGVYVYSEDGMLTKWANPLYPSEPMRVRTGEGETLFSLPLGTEFYLKQERAPDGYLFNPDDIIPVTGKNILVRNAMAGQLFVCVEDDLGNPLSNVELSILSENGEEQTVCTDENGEAKIVCNGNDVYEVCERALPAGTYAPIRVHVHDIQGESELTFSDIDETVTVQTAQATRSRLTFVHPSPGSVRLNAMLRYVGENGEEEFLALSDVHLNVIGGDSVVSNKDGEGVLSLPEGTYDIQFSYEGKEDLTLPMQSALLYVRKGEETPVNLVASSSEGRIVVSVNSARKAQGGKVIFSNVENGESYGPYAFDADGLLVSEPLPQGDYSITLFEAPQDTTLGILSTEDQNTSEEKELLLGVHGGVATHVSAQLLTWESQSFELLTMAIDDDGEQVFSPYKDETELTILDDNGAVAGSALAMDGIVHVSGLSGHYVLRMDDTLAKRLGILSDSFSFDLPSDGDAVVFTSDSARLLLYSVDEHGMAVANAVYRITDGEGRVIYVSTDENGGAVTPPLKPGEIVVETAQNPTQHDVARTERVIIQAGDSKSIELVHQTFGEARIVVSLRSLDALGNERFLPLSGVGVQICYVGEDRDIMEQETLDLKTDVDGVASAYLPEGEYTAQVDADSLAADVLQPQQAHIKVRNSEQTEHALLCASKQGGLRVTLIGGELIDTQLAQICFEAVAEDGSVTQLLLQDGVFYAGELSAGLYVLRQTQAPEGYTLSQERTIKIEGSTVAQIQVPLEEYAQVRVNKTGLTFDDQMHTFVVPLAGEYGVYTLEDGEMRAYPSEQDQATLWANVTPEQIAGGMAGSMRLPAGIDGVTYYLREISSAQGFAQDKDYHEVTLYAGQEAVVNCTVSSDRGFFSLEQTDSSGAHIAGGEFELFSGEGNVVLAFEMGDKPYQNDMALPVGLYTLRQTKAPEGYALPVQTQIELTIEPYLTQGGRVTEVNTVCARIPQGGELAILSDLYAAREQDLSVVSVDSGLLDFGETLRRPQLTLNVTGEMGERTDVISVVLGAARDEQGNAYVARVEYSLSDGGWQPSDARMTETLNTPTTVSLADVQGDICAVRVTYMDASTGLELARGGFSPGNVGIGLRAGVNSSACLKAQASFSGIFDYRTQFDGECISMTRFQHLNLSFETQGDGVFDSALAGRDGRITGTVFADADANGLLTFAENDRFAGVVVQLLDATGTIVDEQKTDEDGHYAFTNLPMGTYSVCFDAGEGVIFSHNKAFSDYTVSAVTDARTGVSDLMVLDVNHTDYVANAGCVIAGRVSGHVAERIDVEQIAGYSGLNVELYNLNEGSFGEPSVVLTSEAGRFAFDELMPGTYDVVLTIPEGYFCADTSGNRISKRVEIAQGEEISIEETIIQRSASVTGLVRTDDDADGVVSEGAEGIPGIGVILMRVVDGHTEELARTVTDVQGVYSFEDLSDGEYSVLFELNNTWTFTRYGKDSLVFGATAQTGSTQNFHLGIGEQLQNINAGVTIPAQLAVYVFKDAQMDGEYEGHEAMLDGVDVTLVQLEDGKPAQETTYRTDETGCVVFTGVRPGEYRLRYQLPGAWRATINSQSSIYPVSCVPQSTTNTGESDVFSLAMGQKDANLYIGAMLTGSISGKVYYDDNADASYGAGENVCERVVVELLNLQNEVLAQTMIANDGSYSFMGIAPGRYRVQFTSEEDSYFSASERSMTGGGVQGSDGPVSTTRVLTVYADKATDSVDAGVVRFAQVSGFIWEDSDADGAMDEDEIGLPNVHVRLMNGAGRKILDDTVTDWKGEFLFERVKPGDYVLCVDAPDTYVFSSAVLGGSLGLDEVRDGRGFSVPFTLLGGASVTHAGYGVFRQGSVSGRVWDDADYDGIMDENEKGIRSAYLTLLDSGGNSVATVTTDQNGEYAFDTLTPGIYALNVAIPEGYVFTSDGGHSRASRQNSGLAHIEIGQINMGQAIDRLDVGALIPAQVLGSVWYDVDDDGRKQSQSTFIQGVSVRLTMLSGTDSGKIYETITDDDGKYIFENVMPGQAQLSFDIPEGYAFAKQPGTYGKGGIVPQTDALTGMSVVFDVEEGAKLSEMDAGIVGVGTITGSIWEDSTYDGLHGKGEVGVSDARVSLIDASTGETVLKTESRLDGSFIIRPVRKGTYTLEILLPDGRIFTRDMGCSAIADVDASVARTQEFTVEMGQNMSGIEIGAITPASICGRVTTEEIEGEQGISGAVLTLMQGGTVISTDQSNMNGDYHLDMLRPGTYRLRVALPQDTLFALETPLTLDNPRSQEGETEAVTLSPGERFEFDPILAVRAGRISGCAWSDDNADGVIGATESPLTGIDVELYAVVDNERSFVMHTVVNEDGKYELNLIRAGAYEVRFTLPEGMLLADKKEQSNASSAIVVPGNIGSTEILTLSTGEWRTDINIGGILPGAIGDTVWLDVNGNGLQDYKEPLVPNVGVLLLRVLDDGSTEESSRTFSDEYGYYRFNALRPGNYIVAMDDAEHTLTIRADMPLGEIDSDLDPYTGRSDTILLRSGQTLLNVDIGLAP